MLKYILYFYFVISSLFARPVSYVNGWTFITMNDNKNLSSLIHFTPSSRYSLGYKVDHDKSKEYWINALNINYLVKRINKKHSQANIYFKSGAGLIYSDYSQYSKKKEFVSYAEISTDWENRHRLYAYNNKVIKSNNIDSTFIQKARFGIAPYVASYGKLHTWLIYELNHMPEENKVFFSNGILRFFKSPNLLEIGMNNDRDILFNFIKRF